MIPASDHQIDGIDVYAPDLNLVSKDYPAEAYSRLVVLEAKSFWFTWRNRIIQHFFKKHVGGGEANVLEVGCGTGFVMEGLRQRFGKYRLSGADIHVAGMQCARERLPKAKFYQLDATRMPFREEYEAVGMFDALEHIQEDESAMRGVHQALKGGGYFFITVPQHPFLWSNEDVLGGHKRRYTRSELLRKLENSGFEVVSCTSFVTTLMPLLLVSRVLGRFRKVSEEDFFTISAKQLYPGFLLNAIASGAMALDCALIKLGVSLPVGGSLLAIGRKR